MKNRKVIISLIAVVSILLVAACGFLFFQMNLQPVSSDSTQIEFQVASGESTNAVIARLDDEGIIKNATMAKIYNKFAGLEAKAGNFALDPSWSTQQILKFLDDSANSGGIGIQVTLREGLWAKDIATELESKLAIPATEFITLWNDDAYLEELITTYDFLSESIINSEYRVKLEGYLFPETYSFSKDSTAKDVTKVMLDHFQTIYDKYKGDIEATGMTPHEIITLASVVQYEAATVDDMFMVAGVFKNRLDASQTLGSSVTVCYALYEDFEKAWDCEVNGGIDSPYNTYIHQGLPIGPVSNPGEAAINAAIHPKKSDYFYFLADIKKDGKVYYSKTLQEHEAKLVELGLDSE